MSARAPEGAFRHTLVYRLTGHLRNVSEAGSYLWRTDVCITRVIQGVRARSTPSGPRAAPGAAGQTHPSLHAQKIVSLKDECLFSNGSNKGERLPSNNSNKGESLPSKGSNKGECLPSNGSKKGEYLIARAPGGTPDGNRRLLMPTTNVTRGLILDSNLGPNIETNILNRL